MVVVTVPHEVLQPVAGVLFHLAFEGLEIVAKRAEITGGEAATTKMG